MLLLLTVMIKTNALLYFDSTETDWRNTFKPEEITLFLLQLTMSTMTESKNLATSPVVKLFLGRFQRLYKKNDIWTLETGCLVFTSFIIYYLIFFSPDVIAVLDIIVIVFFMLGALTYFGSSTLFQRLSSVYQDNACTSFLKAAHKYLFTVLSFLPGLYFAFYYNTFILRIYLVIHFVTTGYFLYKRYKEFELEPFLIGIAMSFVIGSFKLIITGFFSIFGNGWFVSNISSLLVTIVQVGVAVTFLLDLPRQYLPATMLFGLKVVKYLMFITSWQSWFILMVVATWKNIGTATETFWELYTSIGKQNGAQKKLLDHEFNKEEPNAQINKNE